MSEYSYLPHPEDPSLYTIDAKQSSGDVSVKISSYSSRIQKLTQRNVKLQEKLSLKDQEILELKANNDKIHTALSKVSSVDASEQIQKIADLSKTNRHLSAQLMSNRNKARELENTVNGLQKKLEEKEKLEEEPQNPSDFQCLSETLDKTKKKLFEVSNMNVQLKNELKMAHKCLQQELGVETVNLAQIHNGNSSWRGRADQILMLQRKLGEYKEKLEGNDSDFNDSRTSLRQLDSVRRSEIETLTKELENCRNELDGVKQKVVGLNARNKTLLDEGTSYKLKTLELMEKSKNDDDFVKCLNDKIAMVKFEYEHKMIEVKKEAAHVSRLKEETRVEVEKSQVQLENMAEIISDKNNEIENLKMMMKDLEEKLREISGDFLFSCRDMSKKQFVELIQGLEQEKLSLTSIVQNFNDRLNQQVALQNDQHDLITKQKIKISRLEAKIKEFETEKEEKLKKHRRNIRINEYTQRMNGMKASTSKSNENSNFEIDRLKFRLEFATERISYLESKMKELNDEKNENVEKFAAIIGKSKDFFQELYRNNNSDVMESSNESSYVDFTGEPSHEFKHTD